MNKLVIIGNGFDLAHGLKTSYKDFLVWSINKAFRQYSNPKFEGVIKFETTFPPLEFPLFEGIEPFYDYIKDNNINIKYLHVFIEKIFKASYENWVDVEREYYHELVNIYSDRNASNYETKKRLNDLNLSMECIKRELEKYLQIESSKKLVVSDEIINHFKIIFAVKENPTPHFGDIFEIERTRFTQNGEIVILNFNYTSTIENYLPRLANARASLIYIHGKLGDKRNSLIFGYGDETDENYERIEKLNDNDYLKHMKSYAYLQTPNYRKLFEYLDKKDERFEVFIMGHSCGLSDRLLFTHILEHLNFTSVKIYFYDKPDGTNDFFEKSQDLSRYFRLNAKHKMRKVLIPFNESVPLVKYKSKSQN